MAKVDRCSYWSTRAGVPVVQASGTCGSLGLPTFGAFGFDPRKHTVANDHRLMGGASSMWWRHSNTLAAHAFGVPPSCFRHRLSPLHIWPSFPEERKQGHWFSLSGPLWPPSRKHLVRVGCMQSPTVTMNPDEQLTGGAFCAVWFLHACCGAFMHPPSCKKR